MLLKAAVLLCCGFAFPPRRAPPAPRRSRTALAATPNRAMELWLDVRGKSAAAAADAIARRARDGGLGRVLFDAAALADAEAAGPAIAAARDAAALAPAALAARADGGAPPR